MSYKKHKLTKDVQKQLKEYADKLPAIAKFRADGRPMYKPGVVDGAELRRSDMKDGSSPVPGQLYRVNVLMYENHFENLCLIYKAEGMEGVERTIKMLEAIKKRKESALYAALPWYTRLTNWFIKRIYA